MANNHLRGEVVAMRNPIVLTVENVDTFISGGTGLAFPVQAVDERLSYSLPGAWFSPAVRAHRWDGKEHLLDGTQFPTGLLDAVVEVLKECGTEYQIVDNRVFPDAVNDHNLPGIDLYPHQQIAVAIMLKHKRGVVQVPTAGGKTFICAAAIKALNVPCAYIVHTKTLLSQSVEEFKRVGLDVGMFGSGEHTEGENVTVFMVQTLMAHLRRGNGLDMARYKVLIVDECHHLSSDGRKASWYIASTLFEDAAVRFGVSVTPQFKKSGMLLMAATGPLIHSVPMKTLQARKVISESAPTFVDIETPRLPITMDYQETYQAGIIENTARNNVGITRALKYAREGKLVMVFVDRIEHGELLAAEMTQALKDAQEDYVIQFLSGLNPREEIEDVKKLAKLKLMQVLIVTRKLFGEGVDIPAVDVLINLAGGKSATAFIQMFGRGMRKAEGKDELIYIDFYDNTHRYLRAHSEMRLRHCRKLKQEVKREKEPLTHVAGTEEGAIAVAGRRDPAAAKKRKWIDDPV